MFLLQFTWIWNDLLFSTILANRPETRSIMNALLVFQGSYSQNGPNIVMTGALLAVGLCLLRMRGPSLGGS